ncbi:flagellar motor switch protein FliG [Acidisoma silvae]|uniref:Flagellar motor switch protein FliG n=1 Tax=Acidisoma silvae TaxID=2802396 RepID=A0A963YR23_9PROT|nr:flagellar motor switch protein FliG [Acidisoma silvae]MCB8874913.1 flagellar motor switch protein FliG [Acidisoma silvae]
MSETAILTTTLSGAERAALVLRELGEPLAVDILRHMDETTITKISQVMTSLPKVNFDLRDQIITTFVQDFGIADIGEDGFRFLTTVLTSALGETQARTILEQLSRADSESPFQKIDAQTLAMQMGSERPQTLALLLAHIPHDTGAAMLSYLPEQLATDALYRYTLLDAVSPGAINELRDMLGEIIANHAGGLGRQLANLGGPRQAADILNLLQNGLSERMMAALFEKDTETAEKIRENLFTFLDLVKLSDRAIQILLREVPSERLVIALRPVDETLRAKFFGNMSSRMVDLLKEELTNGPPLRRSDAMAAQSEIVTIALKLANDGRIVINASEDLI